MTIALEHSIATLTRERRVWFCDIWGVLHNGVQAYESAKDACMRFREEGGFIVLISNSPRPSVGVRVQLRELSIDERYYDAIVTSGDVTRTLVARNADKRLYFLGPERDLGFFAGMKLNFVRAEDAEVLVCTGLVYDEVETVSDYQPLLDGFAARGVPMICANPDIMVEKGNRLIPCAGALAQYYAAIGQAVYQAGKPFSPIYDEAKGLLPFSFRPQDVLAIGDGVDTDIKGAAEAGVDSVYILSRVNGGDGALNALSADVLEAIFAGRPFRPRAAMTALRW